MSAPTRREVARVLWVLATLGSVSSPPVANIAAGLALIAFATTPDAWPRLRAAAAQPLGRGILVLLGTLALAMCWAQGVPWGQRFAEWWSWRPLLALLIGLALFDEPRSRDRYAGAVVCVLALAAAGSFVLRVLPHPALMDEPGILLRNHTTQGMAFVVGTALAAMLAWTRPASLLARRLLWVAMALFVLNIATITAGRSAHVALLAALAVAGFIHWPGRRRWLVLLLVPLAGGLLLASSSMVRDRFRTALTELDTVQTSPEATSMGIRVVIWTTTREMIEQRPWLGYGIGGFAPNYAVQVRRHEDASANWHDAARATDPHNEYLRLWSQAGVLGLLAFAWFAAGVARQPAPSPYRGAGLGLFCAWLSTSLLNSHFQSFAEAHLIGLVLGALMGAGQPAYTAADQAASTRAVTSS